MKIKSLSVLLTDKCSAACKMCCFSCTPAGRQVLDKDMVCSYIKQAAELGTVNTVGFSGGEAILHYDLLKECMAFASSLGLASTLVTNGFWAADKQEGYKKIAKLAKNGLQKLSISVDQFHQEFVSVATVRNAIGIAQSLNIMASVTLADLKDSDSSLRLMAELRPYIYNKNMVLYPVFPAGAATEQIPEDKLIKVSPKYNQSCSFDHSITLMFDGTLLMCCSQFSREIPLTHLGQAGRTTLKEAIANIAGNDFSYVLLKQGFNWFVDLVENTLHTPLAEHYSVSCHLCHVLFSDPELLRQMAPYVEKEAGRLRTLQLLAGALPQPG